MLSRKSAYSALRGMKRKELSLMITVMLLSSVGVPLIGGVVIGSADVIPTVQFDIIRISGDTTHDCEPAIGNNGDIIWRGSDDNDNHQIMYWDGSSITKLTNGRNCHEPKINNFGQAVWMDNNEDRDIFIWNGSEVVRITNDSFADWMAKINDNGQIAWAREVNIGHDIFFWDGLNTIQLTNNDRHDECPDINNNGYVVWCGSDGNDLEIYLWNGVSVIQITDNDYHDGPPTINDNGEIAWNGYCYGTDDMEVFYWDGLTITQITDNDKDDYQPFINNLGQFAWVSEDSGGDYEIMFWDGTQIIQITDDDRPNNDPDLNDLGHITWTSQNEIFFWNGFNTSLVTQNNVGTNRPILNDNDEIVWKGSDGGDTEIYYADLSGISTPEPNVDLYVNPEDISFSDPNPSQWEKLTIDALVHSVGNLDATCTVSYYIDSLTTENLIYREYEVFVLAGGSTQITHDWVADVSGTHTIIVEITDSDPPETDLTNNIASKDISISEPQGKLKVKACSDKQKYVIGVDDHAEIIVKVTYLGELIEGAAVSVWVFDPTEANSSISMSEVSPGIYAGDYFFTNGSTPGTYRIKVIASKAGYLNGENDDSKDKFFLDSPGTNVPDVISVDLSEQIISPGTDIVISVDVNNFAEVTDISAEVKKHGSKPIFAFPLFDDGTHSDSIPNDGTFTYSLKSNDMSGTFTVDIYVNGRIFENRNVLVVNPEDMIAMETIVGLQTTSNDVSYVSAQTNTTLNITAAIDLSEISITIVEHQIVGEVKNIEIIPSSNIDVGMVEAYIEVSYVEASLPPNVPESSLNLCIWNPYIGDMEPLSPGGVNPSDDIIWGETEHFSEFAVSFEIDLIPPLPATNVHAELTGAHLTVYWDPSPSLDVDHYEIWYIQNDWDPTGDSYIFLGSTGLNSYQHIDVGVNNPNSYFYQVRTYDEVGHETRTIIQSGKLGSTQSTFMNPSGWFLLGSFLVQSDTSLGHVIQGQGLPANWDYAQLYDASDSTDPWKTYLNGRPDSLNDLTDIDNEHGFWLHLTGNSRYATAGYVTDMSIDMKAGWNLVPYPYAIRQKTATQVGTDLMTNCPNFDSWQIFDPDAEYRLIDPNGSENLNHGSAFWVKVTADTTWTVMNY